MTVERYGLSLWGDENVLKWAVVMVSQLKKKKTLLLLALLGLCCCMQTLSGCSEEGLLSRCPDFSCGGFSCYGTRACRHQWVWLSGSRAWTQ